MCDSSPEEFEELETREFQRLGAQLRNLGDWRLRNLGDCRFKG